ncbi:hypothetical protein AB1Y20_002777 [Prymnesium parvum]|uniref:Uncharacterized protein n=1 Tax=Prymnesium parvum TaxID=97485 RepID=A0AB34JAC6_PRYPA
MGNVSMATKGTYGALLGILRYLRDTKDYGIHYGIGIDRKLRAYLLEHSRDLRVDPWHDDTDVVWLADSSQGGERPYMCHIGFVAGAPYTWKMQVAMRQGASNRSKHLLRRYWVLMQRVQAGEVRVVHVRDEANPADFLTKWVPAKKLRTSIAYVTGQAARRKGFVKEVILVCRAGAQP